MTLRLPSPSVPAVVAALFLAFGSARARAGEFPSGAIVAAIPGGDALVRVVELPGPGAAVGGGAALQGPMDLAFAPDGHVYVASFDGDAVLELDADGILVATLGGAAGLDEVAGVALGPRGHLLVTSRSQDRVVELDATGVTVRAYGPADGLDEPAGVRVGPDGHVYVASTATDRVFEYDADGVLVREIGGGTSLDGPARLAFDAAGRLLVTSSVTGTVLVFGAGGVFEQEFGGAASMNAPSGVAVGADGAVLVADASGDLHVFDAAYAHVQSVALGAGAVAGIAAAPYRFKVVLKGVLASGGATTELSEKATLSVEPGSGALALHLAAVDSPIAAALSAEVLSLPGRLAAGSATAKKRAMHALEVPARARAAGVASLDLETKGAVGESGSYAPSKGSGRLHASGDGFGLTASVKIKAPSD